MNPKKPLTTRAISKRTPSTPHLFQPSQLPSTSTEQPPATPKVQVNHCLFHKLHSQSNSPATPQNRLFTGKLENYSIGASLGQGSYAVVKQAKHLVSAREYAIKTYEKSSLTDPELRQNVLREIRVMKKLQHKHIVRIKEAVETNKQVHIVMEHVGGDSLRSHLKKHANRQLPEHAAKRLFLQLLGAVAHCHDNSVTHRDIKLENVMLDAAGNVKLIDFGFAICTAATLNVFCGTPNYMAPEIVAKREYLGACADVWALGVLLYATLVGKLPFKGSTDRETYKNILRGTFECPTSLSEGAKGLLRRLLSLDPSARPAASELLKDPWVGSSGVAKRVSNAKGIHSNDPSLASYRTLLNYRRYSLAGRHKEN